MAYTVTLNNVTGPDVVSLNDGTTYATLTVNANSVSPVVADSTPELGGDLDLNGNDITGTGNINITGTLETSGSVTIGGDLTVNGTTTTINSTTLTVDDLNVVVASGAANAAAADGAGLTVDGANATLTYVAAGDNWALNKALTAPSATLTTADINGGTIDGTVIGGSTPAAISGTTGQFGTSLNVDGTVTSDGLNVLAGNGVIGTAQINKDIDGFGGISGVALSLANDGTSAGTGVSLRFSPADVQTAARGSLVSSTLEGANGSNLELWTVVNGQSPHKSMEIDGNGDISFYEDTGTTPKFFWDASTERLGIGNAAPATSLDVTGTVTADGLTVDGTATVTGTNITIKNDASFLKFENASATRTGYIQSRTDALDIWNDQATPMVFGTANTERMRIDASGNVGIGTSSPASKLTVSGDIHVLATNYLNFTNTAQQTYIRAPATNTLVFGTDSLERLRIDSSGNVIKKVADTFTNGGIAVNNGTYDAIALGTGGYGVNGGAATDGGIRAYNNLLFGTGSSSTERMRIDSTGNVGIGTSSPESKLHIFDATQTNQTITFGDPAATPKGSINYNSSGSEFLTIASKGTTSGYGNIVFQTGPTPDERMRIDSSGNVGIGTISPSLELSVDGDIWQGNRSGVEIGRITNAAGWYDFGGSSNVNGAQMSHVGTLRFLTASTERMRIDSSGNLLVGTTSQISATSSRVNILNANEGLSGLTIGNAGGSGNTNCILFVNSNGTVGTIRTNGSATAYNTSSDYRLKEDVHPMSGASDRVLALNPVNFAWKSDGTRTDGFIAHEVQEVAPYAVTGEKDGEEMQAMDHSKLAPLLTAALQEALQKIEALEARITALEA